MAGSSQYQGLLAEQLSGAGAARAHAQSQRTCTELPLQAVWNKQSAGVAPSIGGVLLGRTVVKRVRVVVQARQTLGVAGIADLREP